MWKKLVAIIMLISRTVAILNSHTSNGIYLRRNLRFATTEVTIATKKESNFRGGKKLVIVESPAKAKTIQGFLSAEEFQVS